MEDRLVRAFFENLALIIIPISSLSLQSSHFIPRRTSKKEYRAIKKKEFWFPGWKAVYMQRIWVSLPHP
jgi:hypothetical protein